MKDCFHWALGNACFTVDALLRVNVEHFFALVKTFHGANNYAVGITATHTWLGDDVSHASATFLSTFGACNWVLTARRHDPSNEPRPKWSNNHLSDYEIVGSCRLPVKLTSCQERTSDDSAGFPWIQSNGGQQGLGRRALFRNYSGDFARIWRLVPTHPIPDWMLGITSPGTNLIGEGAALTIEGCKSGLEEW